MRLAHSIHYYDVSICMHMRIWLLWMNNIIILGIVGGCGCCQTLIVLQNQEKLPTLQLSYKPLFLIYRLLKFYSVSSWYCNVAVCNRWTGRPYWTGPLDVHTGLDFDLTITTPILHSFPHNKTTLTNIIWAHSVYYITLTKTQRENKMLP